MTSTWIMLIPSQVFTRIKTEFSEKIKTKYSMTIENFSTTDSQNKKAVFPFVYISLLPSYPNETDLERKIVDSVPFAFQIDVYDNKSQNRANDVAGEVLRIMHDKLSFLPKPMPSFSNDGDVFRNTARYERVIDINDIL